MDVARQERFDLLAIGPPNCSLAVFVMSNFQQMTKHPETGEMQMAEWLDDHFGRHRYAVRFPDGKVFRESEIEAIDVNGVKADCSDDLMTVKHWDGSSERHR